MSGLFENQQTEEQDNLSEYRMTRIAFFQQAIDAEYVTFKAACEAVKSSSLRMCELLRAAHHERIYCVDGYENMTQWVEARWPMISKSQLSRAILGGAILEEYEGWVSDRVAKNGNLATLPRPENQGQLRAMASVEPENRQAVYELAVETTGGAAPSARVISETDAALNGKNCTNERISRLDLNRTAAPPSPPNVTQPKHRRGWVEDMTVDGRYLTFTARDYEFTSKTTGKLIKPKMFVGIKLGDLADVGFIHKNDAERLREALKWAEEQQREYDRMDEEDAQQKTLPIVAAEDEPLPGSLLADDMSHLDNFFNHEDEPQ